MTAGGEEGLATGCSRKLDFVKKYMGVLKTQRGFLKPWGGEAMRKGEKKACFRG